MSYLTKAIAPQLYLLTNDDEFELLYQKLETTLATGLIGLIQIRRKKPWHYLTGQRNCSRKREELLSWRRVTMFQL